MVRSLPTLSICADLSCDERFQFCHILSSTAKTLDIPSSLVDLTPITFSVTGWNRFKRCVRRLCAEGWLFIPNIRLPDSARPPWVHWSPKISYLADAMCRSICLNRWSTTGCGSWLEHQWPATALITSLQTDSRRGVDRHASAAFDGLRLLGVFLFTGMWCRGNSCLLALYGVAVGSIDPRCPAANGYSVSK